MHGYFEIITATASFVSRVVCAVIFKYHYCYEFCFCFRVACAVIFNYRYYNEFCFPGGVRVYFLITTTIANFVFREACTVIY